MHFKLRNATDSDRPAIANVILAAFGEAEGREIRDLVTDLLADPTAQPSLSLVATAGEKVVGHVLFTSGRIRGSKQGVSAAILAPLAVRPDYQDHGIGGRLIAEGLRRLEAAGVLLVFVLGDPGYYSRHGFSPAGIEGLDAPCSIPSEYADAWMVQALSPGVLERVSGQVVCADALHDPKHWQE